MTAGAPAERRDQLRREAEALGLEGVLVFSWRRRTLTWLTGYTPGFATNFGMLWLPSEGAPLLGVKFGFERTRAEADSGLDVVSGVHPMAVVPATARRIGLVTGDFAIDECPPRLVIELARLGIEAVDLIPIVDELRAIKSGPEIDDLAAATRTAEAALATLSERDRGSESDFGLAALVEGRARTFGAQRALCLVGIGDGAVVTEPSGVTVRPGDVICVELTMHTATACTQVAATILPDSPPAHALRATEACCEARAAVVESLRPGQPIKTAVANGYRTLKRLGLDGAFEYDFGHGIGVDTPEHPVVTVDGDRLVAPGMVVVVHAGLRRPAAETAFVGGPVLIEPTGACELVEAGSRR